MRTRIFWTGLAAALSLALPLPASAYKAGSVKNGGSISGKISFEGKAPAWKVFSVNKDKRVCGKKPILSEKLVVKDGGIQWAVVRIKGIKSGKKWGKKLRKPVVDQNGCQYKPHIAIAKPGVRVYVLNSDKILHNFHTHPGDTKNPVANIAQPKFKKKLKLSKRYFRKPGIVRATCDVHDWMEGYIVVAENPYTEVTAADGSFKITNVPPGSYEVEIWQEKLGVKTVKVDVKGGQDTKLNVAFK